MIIRKRIARGKNGVQQERDAQQEQSVQQERSAQRTKNTKKRKKKGLSPASLLHAAADPGKRAVMTKVWKRRRRRAEVLSGAVRIAIRYLNAKDQKTVYRR